jgi:hypothetical protein
MWSSNSLMNWRLFSRFGILSITSHISRGRIVGSPIPISDSSTGPPGTRWDSSSPKFRKSLVPANSSFINCKIKGSVSLVVTEAGLFLRCPNHHIRCPTLVCTEHSANVIDFAVFIAVFRKIFLEHLQSTKERDIKDLKKM